MKKFILSDDRMVIVKKIEGRLTERFGRQELQNLHRIGTLAN